MLLVIKSDLNISLLKNALAVDRILTLVIPISRKLNPLRLLFNRIFHLFFPFYKRWKLECMTVNGKTIRDSFPVTSECYCIAAIFDSSLITSSGTFKPRKVLAELLLPSLHTGLYQQLNHIIFLLFISFAPFAY